MDRRGSFSRSQFISQYLIFYNLISALLWVTVLGRVILLVPLVGFQNVYGGVGEFTKWTQTAAVMEILHSALGN
jgi:very-long-chain (3R)-3-hydroxyacyl-CoA dehydratase